MLIMEYRFSAEHFWVDLTFVNPLNVAVSLSSLSLVVDTGGDSGGPSDDPEIEAIEEVYLNARERRTVCHRYTRSGSSLELNFPRSLLLSDLDLLVR